MAKLFPISLKVESMALGDVLMKLKSMPGIVEINLNLDDNKAVVPVSEGGNGQQKRGATIQGIPIQQALLQHMKDGPKSTTEMAAHIGDRDVKRVSGAVHHLQSKGFAERVSTGVYKLTAGGRRKLPVEHIEHEVLKALTGPNSKTNGHTNGHNADAKRLGLTPKKNGEKPPRGTGNSVILQALQDGPKKVADLASAMVTAGLSENSWRGRYEKLRDDGLVKNDGHGTYELTAKGVKEAATLQAGA